MAIRISQGVILFAIVLGPATGVRGQDQEPAPAPAELFQQAGQLEDAEQWAEAADIYAQILELLPDSHQAAVSLGVCWFNDGQVEQAIPTLQSGISLDEFTWWAEKGLYYLASAQHALDQDNAALESIDMLSARFPDSPWHAQATIVAAQIAGLPTLAVETAAAAELVAFNQYRAALQADDRGQALVCLEMLEAVIAAHPNTGAAYRALESKGFIHGRNVQRAEYLAAFQQILTEVGEVWPQSRLVANAKLQKAGAFFGLLMLPGDLLGLIEPAQWEEVRALCQEVLDLEQASPQQIARAKLMIVETCHWQKCWAEALEGAQAYIDEYDAADFRPEVATAHMVAGEMLHMLGQPGPAMQHFQWIINEYAPDEEIWPGLKNLARTYYWTFDILYQAQAPLGQLIPAGDEILELFPGTRYAELVQNALNYIEQNGWPNP